jgi:hypothetical protein
MEKHQENVEDVAITLLLLEDMGLCYADNASENLQVK